MATKTEAIHAFDFFKSTIPKPAPFVAVCFGTDDFLRRTAIVHLLRGSGLTSESVRSFEGDECSWRDVHDQLATRSLFDELGGRAAIVRSADKFITRSRESLENWVERKPSDAMLILDVHTFPANTKLYTSVGKHGLLVKCTPPQKSAWGNPPDDKAIAAWIIDWGKLRHGVVVSESQALLMVERIGGVCGLIDCELAKLALFADAKGRVDDSRVKELVGGWRCQTTWEVADAIADGRVAYALEQLEKLTHAGQNVLGVTAQVSWSLRRYGIAAQFIEQSERSGQKIALGTALERAGFHRFDIAKAEKRLRRIGRERAKRLVNDLVHLETQLKGSHSQENRARFALESLILSLG